MNGTEPARRWLIINADDYGYSARYNDGIMRVVEAGMIDSVSAMTEREHCDPGPLLAAGVEIGLHVEFEGRWGARSGAPARNSLRVQLERFTDLFGRWPSYLDGHHHCHARPELASPIFETALQLGLPVRSVSADHRQLLRERNIPTNDHLIGRMDGKQPAEPAELRDLGAGVTEWVVHPGLPDPEGGSSFDLPRQEDMNLLLTLGVRARFDTAVWGNVRRGTHAEALARPDREREAAAAELDELISEGSFEQDPEP